jgi:putative flippase GtrA
MNICVDLKLIKFLLVGFLAFSFDYLLYAVTQKYYFSGCYWSSRPFFGIVSNTISYSGGFLISFLLNRIWVFKSNYNIRNQFLKYFVLFVFNLIWSDILLYYMLADLKLNTYLSKIFLIGIVTIWNYVMYKYVIFKSYTVLKNV